MFSFDEMMELFKLCIKNGVRKNWPLGKTIDHDMQMSVEQEFIRKLNFRPGQDILGKLFCDLFDEGIYSRDVMRSVQAADGSSFHPEDLPITKEIAKKMCAKSKNITINSHQLLIGYKYSREKWEEKLKEFFNLIDHAELVFCYKIGRDQDSSWGSYVSLSVKPEK